MIWKKDKNRRTKSTIRLELLVLIHAKIAIIRPEIQAKRIARETKE